MWINAAYAQSAAPAGGTNDILISLMPFVLIFVIMYFLILRPQQKRQKQVQDMLGALRRGDVIVTTGGLIGKISKVVDENELVVDLTDAVKVRIVRSAVAEVRAKSEPVKDA